MWKELCADVNTEGCSVMVYWSGDPESISRVGVHDPCWESPESSSRINRVARRVVDAHGGTSYMLAWERGEEDGESVAFVVEAVVFNEVS